ncbi:BREX system ATP-binding domain-containing protein [Kribbella sp. NPDC056861]|uniref:helix-turn-helix transcriptional regulator n=1 Tax=Kribbella sp. NPDC056861 TaxID=3154857 RepID=UPI003437DCAC
MSAMVGSAAPAPQLRGREREWTAVRGVLDAAARGRGRLVVVDGAAGSGKSMLLTAAANLAASRGFAVARADVTPAGTEGEHDRGRPRLVAVDDQQSLDRTVDTALSERILDRRVVWIVVRRAGAVAEWLPPAVVLLELGSLPDKAVAELASDILYGRPDAELLSMAAGAGGNPLLLVSLFEGLRDENLATVAQGQVRLARRQVPRRTAEIVDAWVQALSPAACNLLEVAACLEPVFTLDTLAAMFGRSPARLLAPLDELVGRDLLLIGLQGVLTFRHELVRQSVLHQVPCAIRDALRAESPSPAATSRRQGCGPDSDGWEQLSQSERSIAELVAAGMTNREAAERLLLSPHTISFHLRKIYRKLGIVSRIELTRIALAGDRTGGESGSGYSG